MTSNIPVFSLYGETDQFPDVVHCEQFSARAPVHDWRISAHRHAHLAQLFLIESGGIEAAIDNTRLTLNPSDFLYVPALCVHRFEFVPETSGHVISMRSDVVNTLAPATADLRNALAHPVAGQISPALETLADLLNSASRSRSSFRIQRAISLAHSMLSLIAETAHARTTPRPQGAESRLNRLDQLILDHMSEGWTASDYASQLAITTGHLSRLCRTAAGLGATAYIERTIMQEACRLLAFTQTPVSEIGYRLGYADPSYFTKRFQKSRQRTPTQYRAQFTD